MAINDNKGDNKGQGQGDERVRQAFSAADLGGGSAADEPRGQRRRSTNSDLTAAGIDSFFGRHLRQAPTNQNTKEFEKVYSKTLEDSIKVMPDDPLSFHVNSIDSTDSQDVAIAALLVTSIVETSGARHGVVYTILLDGSMDSYPTREIRDAPPVNGRPLELPLTAGDYADQPLWNAIVTKLQGIYGNDVAFEAAGNGTLPRYVSVEKEEHKPIIYSSLFDAVGAIETYIERKFEVGAPPLTIRDITNRATNQILMDLNDTPDISAMGEPIRNDISMTLKATVRSNVQGVPDKVVDVVKLSAFVNLIYTNPPPRGANERPDTRRYTPQIVLTNLVSKTSLMTPETQLLALAMAPLLNYNDQYLAPFTASATANRPGRDFGALGLEVDFSGDANSNGQPLGHEDISKMSTSEFFSMARMALFPELHVALAINESGAQTWLNSMFLDAANQTGGEAYNTIVDAANNLTGDVFGKLWNGGMIARSAGTRIHMGYYIDDNNERRDLLDIDYLWMLNRCGAKNLDRVWEFGDTFLANDVSPDAQLVTRWNIIQQFVRNATLIGYGQIVELDPDFLLTLIQAIKTAGLPLRANNSLVDFQGARGRASYQPSDGGLSSTSVASVLNAGDNQRRGPSNYGGLGLNSSWRR